MELLYLYIKEYDGLFENEQFNFSSKYIAELRNNELSINENHNSIKDYYGNNVSNVVMFLGKNGMGKSTLLDILGMDYHDRCKDLKYRKTEKNDGKTGKFEMRKNMPKVKGEINLFLGLSHKKYGNNEK